MLILGGISGAGMTTFMEDYRPIFIILTFGFLGSAFYFTYRPRGASANGGKSGGASTARPSGRDGMMAFNKIMLWAVTVIAIVFLFFPQALTGLFASDDQFTEEMQQTVVRIEGMT